MLNSLLNRKKEKNPLIIKQNKLVEEENGITFIIRFSNLITPLPFKFMMPVCKQTFTADIIERNTKHMMLSKPFSSKLNIVCYLFSFCLIFIFLKIACVILFFSFYKTKVNHFLYSDASLLFYLV